MEGELSDVETQLDSLVGQIRKTESEKKELLQFLPEHGAAIEQQLREAEYELSECESYLPIYHNQAAAKARYNTARKQAADAHHDLKNARSAWKKTLHQLGLAESLSPKSIRILSEGYETLMLTRKKLVTQADELTQRKIELTSSLQKLDALYTQMQVALASPGVAGSAVAGLTSNSSRSTPVGVASNIDRSSKHGQLDRNDGPTLREASSLKPSDLSVEAPQQKLQQLLNTLAQHKQYLAQRKELKREDEELAKKQKAGRRTHERLISSRQAALAEIGVESVEQLDQLLSRKREHLQLETQIAGLDERIRAMLGNHVSYEATQRMLQNTTANELEKRWETLSTRISGAEERIGQLQQRQGEIHQEMKTLAADRRLAEAKLELSCIERQIELSTEHWRTLGLTTCMLEKVCEVYETERQPETLREASSFLKQLTEGKYVRVWTPLGKNALRIDNDKGQSLPLEVLSRGTREAVFIALRLSLAAAYARRGATLPLVLDDVLVNFDSLRATNAAKVLRDFAALGHQVVMFTCHEHIMRMFDSIGVQVRVLPTQGEPGVAEIYHLERPRQPKIELVAAPEPVVVAEPEPLVMPAKTHVAAAPQPETIPFIPKVNQEEFEEEFEELKEPIGEGLPLWFEQEVLEKPLVFDALTTDGWWEEFASNS